jgi:hypothetical protein
VAPLATTSLVAADEGDGPGSAAVGKQAAAEVGPLPSEAGTASAGGGTTSSPGRPASAATSAPAVPLRVADRLAAAQDGGDDSTPGAAHAAALAGGVEEALALLDVRPAGPAAPHGQAGPADDALEVILPGDVRLVRGGTPAEGAALDGEAPAAAPTAYAAFAARPAPFAGALLDRLALDTRALDAALQGLSHGLDRLGEHLSDPRSRLGVAAWVLTGVAALTALEWDRRRRAAAGADEVPLSWMDPEGPAL